jgi:FkbM family methyltransferase
VSRAALAELLKKIPPFTRPESRYRFTERRAAVARRRRDLFERFGSPRYSRPALFDMDRKLERYLNREGGVFVEAGAHDGYVQSNTYFLERFRGWTGVLIEPIPELWEHCVRDRPRSICFNCALVPADFARRAVHMRYGGLMSVVAGARGTPEDDEAHAQAGSMLGWDRNYELEVPARTLDSVLDEARIDDFDFLSLDVEGFELDVLRGLDLDRHRAGHVLVEMLVGPETSAAVDDLLTSRYERVAQLSPHDVLYRRRDG